MSSEKEEELCTDGAKLRDDIRIVEYMRSIGETEEACAFTDDSHDTLGGGNTMMFHCDWPTQQTRTYERMNANAYRIQTQRHTGTQHTTT